MLGDEFAMVYDRSERGVELRKRHQYVNLGQVGSQVTYEYKECSQASCFCHKAFSGGDRAA